MNKKLLIALMGLAAAGIASAADVDVTNSITTSVTWTSDNTYHLRDVIYVEPGATLTIQAGTDVIGYDDTELQTFWGDTNRTDSAALVIARGAQIFANGTKDNPITFTSDEDRTLPPPFGGVWRKTSSEWGNLTILGDAIIADGDDTGGVQNGNCEDDMEGLQVGTYSKYGGDNDDDSSGSLSYVSLRYGGSVIGTANELNGLSLGGVGRGTTIDHIEIMNNVDDGIEIWGGTVGLKYVSIWNIGDDSFDLDEGFRGKAQFGLIVQGLSSTSAAQGSGLGDNCFEMDGGEKPNAMQPYANPVLYNFTVIGNPDTGDYGMAMRDNMRIQLRNSVFVDVNKDLLIFDEGTGSDTYSLLTNAWFTSVDSYTTNGFDMSNPLFADTAAIAALYDDARYGNWSEVSDCVFYNVGDTTTATAMGMFDADNNNIIATTNPVALIERDSVAYGSEPMHPVTNLNPCAANDAVTSDITAPADGFFTPVAYKGAFSPSYNWLEGWTAADEYGMTDTSMNVNSDPSSTIQLTASTFFQTVDGVSYTVEESADMASWIAVGSVAGDGSIMSVTDLDAFDSAKFYRVVVQ